MGRPRHHRNMAKPTTADSLRDPEQIMRDHAQTTERRRDGVMNWLAATIAALNAGALVSTLGLYDHLSRPRLCAVLFAIGVLLSLVTAASYLIALSLIVDQSDALADSYANKGLSLSDPKRVALIKKIETSHRLLWPAVFFGSLATATLFVGTVTVAVSFKGEDRANKRRCEAIQRDMLRSHPHRQDSADLFQAFGCEPEGEGSVYAPLKR